MKLINSLQTSIPCFITKSYITVAQKFSLKFLGQEDDFLDTLQKKEPFRVSGNDAYKVFQVEDKVYKFYNASTYFDSNTQCYDLTRFKLHNTIFGEQTSYSFEGYLQNDYIGKIIVLSQPFITHKENTGNDARLQLKDDLIKRFGKKSLEIVISKESPFYGHLEGDWYIKPAEISLDDLKDSNIFINEKTQQYAVIDCIIHQEPYSHWSSKISQWGYGRKSLSF